MSDEEKYYVAFSAMDGIGPARFKLLKTYFGSAKNAYSASKNELLHIGLSENICDRLVKFRDKFDIDSYLLRLEKLDVRSVTIEQLDYPTLLKQTANPPIVLYVKALVSSDLSLIFSLPSIAIVGTRKVTPYGRQVTQMITAELVLNGFCVVSGLALGVDGITHQTVLESRGKTIAVMGCGLDQVYPSSHRVLADKIIESGGIWVSEYPLGTRALPGNFPARNRIISGLSLGVVVTEAAEDSGSLITARCATEQGRDVFAVPGPITSQVSGGTLSLIKQGAIPIASVNDILEILPGFKKTNTKTSNSGNYANLSTEELAVVDLLKNGDLALDEISQTIKIPAESLASILSMLEIKGVVVGDNGKYFLRK